MFPGLVPECKNIEDYKYPRPASSFSSVSRRKGQDTITIGSSQGDFTDEIETALNDLEVQD